MSYALSLSQLLNLVQDTIDAQFAGQAFWIKCEVTDVKRYDAKNWCFCRLLEKKGGQVIAESPGVFWQQGYQHIRRFEQATGTKFENGIEISALTLVKFHARFGFKLEIIEIDLSFALGQMEMARQATLNRLLNEYPLEIKQEQDQFITQNNQLPLPGIIQRVALIAANQSDGQRDFLQELTQNAHGYQFAITGFYTAVQGDGAAAGMVKQFEQVAANAHLFDVVVLVRGGGSQTDLKPFDDFELSRTIALFPLPVLTGIGHDRNTSIADLMARQHKVPAKVASAIIDHNHSAELGLLSLDDRMEDVVNALLSEKKRQLHLWQQQMQWILPNRIALKKQRVTQLELSVQAGTVKCLQNKYRQIDQLHNRVETGREKYLRNLETKLFTLDRLVEQLSPQTVLKRGFALAEQDGKIVTDPKQLNPEKKLTTRLARASIESTIIKIEPL